MVMQTATTIVMYRASARFMFVFLIFRPSFERLVVGDLVGDKARQVVLALERKQIVGGEVAAHRGAPVAGKIAQDDLGQERRARVLMAADAVGARVAGAALEVRVRAPGRPRRLRGVVLLV